jgi:hypothetical protein
VGFGEVSPWRTQIGLNHFITVFVRMLGGRFAQDCASVKSVFTVAAKCLTASRLAKSQRYARNVLPKAWASFSIELPLGSSGLLTPTMSAPASRKRQRERFTNTSTETCDQRGFAVQPKQFENAHLHP